MRLVEAEGLRFSYPAGRGEVLKGVDLNVGDGELVVIMGSSAAGKSTLLKVLAGVSPYLTGGILGGEVRVQGRNMKRREERDVVAGRVFYMPQEPEHYIIFRWAVTEATVPYLGSSSSLHQAELEGLKALRRWLPHLPPDSPTSTLSAGEKQRLVLSHLEASSSELYLLDEPLTHLDSKGRELFHRCVTEKVRQGGSAVVVTPSSAGYEQLIRRADEVLLMEGGRIMPIPEHADLRGGTHPRPRAPGAYRGEMDPPAPFFKRPSESSGGGAPRGRKRGASKAQKRRPVVEARSLEVSFGRGELFGGLTFTIFEGDVFLIKGPNGSGKTTLIRTLLGFVRPRAGEVRAPWLGKDGWKGVGGVKVGYLPQNPLDLFTCETFKEDLRLSWLRGRRCETFSAALRRLLRTLHLEGLEGVDPYDLSTGQRQRAAIAAVLIGFPQVLFLDEPTRGMDSRSSAALEEILKGLVPSSTIVISTHTHRFDALASRTLNLNGGGSGG